MFSPFHVHESLLQQLFLWVSACSPHPLDTLRDPNIIRLKLVETNRDQHSRNIEKPIRRLADSGMLPYREIVCDAIPVYV